ncbi:hypothetical protein OH76DRAFT_1490151 [Lentinus brumalis]|uniref:Uncharacterized protein n=1 Tax=Lentinus brumalis TaxID=2498619 RepID=A0A371CJY3_9APHY|nr:hypothetical protein OH76DRAFT_1490151 [Polyporus brumalis]
MSGDSSPGTMPSAARAFLQPSVHSSPNSQNLMDAYMKRMVATPTHAAGEPILEFNDTRVVYHHFRTFAKTAARSSVLLSSSAHSAEDVHSAYLSLTEGLEGLRRALLRVYGLEDSSWLTASVGSPMPRLPSLLASMEGSLVLGAAPVPHGEGHTHAAAEEGPDVERAPSTPSESSLPLTPLAHDLDLGRETPGPPPCGAFPRMEVVVLSPESDSLIVPTSCPHEVEFPYSLAYPDTFALDEFASGQPVGIPVWVPSIEETIRLERASRIM